MQGASHSDGSMKWTTAIAGNLLKGSVAGSTADVICLQECTEPPPSVVTTGGLVATQTFVHTESGDEVEARLYRWYPQSRRAPAVYITYSRWGARNPRCSTAVITRHDPSELSDAFCDMVWGEGSTAWRPALGVLMDLDEDTGWNSWVYSFHGISGSGGGADARTVLRQISHKGLASWLVAGDYNREPERLPGRRADGVPDEAAIYRTRRKTHSSRDPVSEYDYAVASRSIGRYQSGSTIPGLESLSDHLPVVMSIG